MHKHARTHACRDVTRLTHIGVHLQHPTVCTCPFLLKYHQNIVISPVVQESSLSGFLVPTAASSGHTSRCVVMLLEGLEKASSLTGLLGDLCHSLDTRDSSSPLLLNTGTFADGQILESPSIEVNMWTSCVYPGPHHFCDGSFLIATLSKPRLQGSELRLQQHFRWVTLRWDQEPLHGLLGRQLRRKLLHKVRRCLLPDRFHYQQLHESLISVNLFPPDGIWNLVT